MNFAICVTTILVIMIILTIYIKNNHKNQQEMNIVNKSEINVLKMCQVPNLSMKKCFKNEYNKYPKYNGSYNQCTNNNIPEQKQQNCHSENETFEISDKYYKKYMTNIINKHNDIKVDNENPRVNVWKGDIKNDNFFIQHS